MRGIARIIGRLRRQVNGLPGVLVACVGLAVFLVATAGCGGEAKEAERAYREAVRTANGGDYEAALEQFEDVVRRFPSTPAGEQARKAALLYRGLREAVDRDSPRRARELLVATARALERYRRRHRSYPRRLADLVPDLLAADPVDPWGRPLHYRRKGSRGYVLETLGADGKIGGDGTDEDVRVDSGAFVSTERGGS